MKAESGTIDTSIDLTEGLEKENIFRFLNNNRLLIYLWAITAVLDAFSTNLFMMYTGPEDELNVLTRICCNLSGIYFGPYIAGVLKFALAIPFLVAIKKFGTWALLLSTGGQIYAIFANINIYKYFTENSHYIAAFV